MYESGRRQDSWLRYLRARGGAPTTEANYTYATDNFLEYLRVRHLPTDVAKVTRRHCEDWVTHVADTRSHETARSYFIGLHAFFNYCADEDHLGVIDRSPMAAQRLPLARRQGSALAQRAAAVARARRGARRHRGTAPHLLRHVFVDAAFSAGMSESEVMALVGWSSAAMCRRYAAARREARAVESYRRLGIGDPGSVPNVAADR